MRKILARLAILTLFAAALTTAGSAYANAGAMHSRWGARKAEARKVIAALNLTGAQKAQMGAVAGKYRPEIKPLLKNLRVERKKLGALMNANKIDDAAIRAQAGKVSSIGADLAVKRAHEISELKAVLTPEQMQTLKDSRLKPGVVLTLAARRAGKR